MRTYFVNPVGGGGPTLHVGNRCGISVGNIIDLTTASTAVGRSIRISIYQMNDTSLLDKLEAAARAGVAVFITTDNRVDPRTARRSVAYHTLKNRINIINREGVAAGVAGFRRIRLKGVTGLGDYGVMHRKLIAVEYGETRHAIMGSYNFTNNAAKMSYENCIRLSHLATDPDIAADDALVVRVDEDGDIPAVNREIGNIRTYLNALHAGAAFPDHPHMDFGQAVIPDLPPPPPAPPAGPDARTAEIRRRIAIEVRIQGLKKKRDEDPIRFSDSDLRELRRLERERR